MKRSITIMLSTAIAISVMAAGGNTPQSRQDDGKKSFDEFRKGILTDFHDFRKTVLEHYADFLDGEWHEYENLKGENRYEVPKPKTAPKAEIPVSPKSPDTPKSPKSTNSPKAPIIPKAPKAPKAPIIPNPQEKSVESAKADDVIDFYGLSVNLPSVEFKTMRHIAKPTDYAENWRTMASDKNIADACANLKAEAEKMGLNDYLTFQLVKSYVTGKFENAENSTQFSIIHFILANMGYDIRIAAAVTGTPILLIPFQQKVYAHNYMMVNGERYYLFMPDDVAPESINGVGILTCDIPSGSQLGSKFDLRLGELHIPEKPKSFSLKSDKLTLQGVVNENLMPILYHYPQMPVQDYAMSNISPALRESLVKQVKEQLSGEDGDAKVEELLHFMHNAFEYATDEDFHGFEKPYFLEETLYYPKNDCEDRAIFYTWILWNALGRKSQLVTFPGHEAATVQMDNPVSGSSYTFDGEVYYMSDPTFIGARTGMAMPVYRDVAPIVDYTYGK